MRKTPFFKEFGPLLFGRKAKSKLTSLVETNQLEDLHEMFGSCFPWLA